MAKGEEDPDAAKGTRCGGVRGQGGKPPILPEPGRGTMPRMVEGQVPHGVIWLFALASVVEGVITRRRGGAEIGEGVRRGDRQFGERIKYTVPGIVGGGRG